MSMMARKNKRSTESWMDNNGGDKQVARGIQRNRQNYGAVGHQKGSTDAKRAMSNEYCNSLEQLSLLGLNNWHQDVVG